MAIWKLSEVPGMLCRLVVPCNIPVLHSGRLQQGLHHFSCARHQGRLLQDKQSLQLRIRRRAHGNWSTPDCLGLALADS